MTGFITTQTQESALPGPLDVTAMSINDTQAAGANFVLQFIRNPVPSLYREWELGNTREQAFLEDYTDGLRKSVTMRNMMMFNPVMAPTSLAMRHFMPERIDELRDGELDLSDPAVAKFLRPGTVVLSANEASAEGEPFGLSFKRAVTKAEFDLLKERKITELRLQSQIARARGEFGSGVMQFSSGLVASVFDPVNIAVSFIPFANGARWAQLTARAGARAFFQRTAFEIAKQGVVKQGQRGIISRFSTGAIDGFLGNAMVEPIIYSAAKEEQADYSDADVAMNLAFGGLLGGGLHVGAGWVRDAVGRARARRVQEATELAQDVEDILEGGMTRTIEDDLDPQTRRDALTLAVNNMTEGKAVEVEAAVRSDMNYREPDGIDIGDIPEINKVKKVGDEWEASFKEQVEGKNVSAQRGKTKEEAMLNLLARYVEASRLSKTASADIPAVFRAVKDRKGVYAANGWEIRKGTSKKTPWTLYDPEGNKLNSYKTLEEAKQANRTLTTSREFFDEAKGRVRQEMDKLNKKASELDDPANFEKELRKLGVPVDKFKKLEAQIQARKGVERDALIARAQKGKGRKRLRKFDEETAELERQLAEEKRRFQQEFTKASAELSRQRTQIRKEFRDLQKELDTAEKRTHVDLTPDSLTKEANKILEARSYLYSPEAVKSVDTTLKTKEKFVDQDIEFKDTVEDTQRAVDDIEAVRQRMDLTDEDLELLDGLTNGEASRLLTQSANTVNVLGEVINDVTVRSFADVAGMDDLAKGAGFEGMADFRQKIIDDVDSIKEMDLPTELNAEVNKTVQRLDEVKDAMRKGVSEDDILAQAGEGKSIRELIPENPFDVEIRKNSATGKALRDYASCLSRGL